MLDARKYGILDCLFSLLRNSFPWKDDVRVFYKRISEIVTD
jgi:hypothetical protein